MSYNSDIEWTDATWNPTRGCNKVSPGCKHCYAETFAERFRGVPGHPYERGFDFRLAPDKLPAPLRWKKPRTIFVNSMSDLFHKDVPNEYIAAVFGIMSACPQHTFQVLTKRADRLPEWFAWWHRVGMDPAVSALMDLGVKMPPDYLGVKSWPLPNVWMGVSVEDQPYADERIPLLQVIPAAVRFLSIEPQVGPVDRLDLSGIGWVIVGGESGAGARPFDLVWARSIIAKCKAAGVPCFYKQGGASHRCAHSPKGGHQECMPEDLRVREYPR